MPETLPHVAVPTLVLHRRGDRALNPANASYLADRIPHARLVLLPGDDTVLWAGDIDPIAAEIDRWLKSLANGLDTPPTARPRPADPSKA